MIYFHSNTLDFVIRIPRLWERRRDLYTHTDNVNAIYCMKEKDRMIDFEKERDRRRLVDTREIASISGEREWKETALAHLIQCAVQKKARISA